MDLCVSLIVRTHTHKTAPRDEGLGDEISSNFFLLTKGMMLKGLLPTQLHNTKRNHGCGSRELVEPERLKQCLLSSGGHLCPEA